MSLPASPAAARAARLQRFRTDPRVSVLIVGGGINGAGTFRDLAAQGVDCLLIDKADFCSGTSAAPSRLIHGGLKYLETGAFRLVAESARERNLLLRNAPHVVKPLATVVPLRSYAGGLWPALMRFSGRKASIADRGLLIVECGLALYDWLGRRHRVMPRHRTVLRRRAPDRFPGLDPAIVALSTYYDARITQAERLCYELVADGEAAHPGACALNYVALAGAAGPGVTVRDERTGEIIEIVPRVVVNAAGPWIDRVNGAVGLNKTYIGGTKGSHLLIDDPALVQALDGQMIYFGSPDGRICLVYPFYGRVLLGATDLKADDPDDCRCDAEEVAYLLGELNALFPQRRVTAEQIVYRTAGIRPLPASDTDDPKEISRDHSIGRDTVPGTAIPMLSLIGGKWTTFRAFAADVTDDVLSGLGRTRLRSTAHTPIGGGRGYPATPAARRDWLAVLARRFGLDPARAEALFERYGTRAETLLALEGGPETPLDHLPAYSAGEIRAIAALEQVVSLEDLVFRRTAIALSEALTEASIFELATILGPVLGWSDGDRRAQTVRVMSVARDRHGVRFC